MVMKSELTFDWGYFVHCPACQLLRHRRSPYSPWTQPGHTTGTRCLRRSQRAVVCERRIWQDVDRWQLKPAGEKVATFGQLLAQSQREQMKWKFSASIFVSSSFHKHPETLAKRFLLNEKLIFRAELTVKSWGVPGLMVGFRGSPSWCEWMSVSSRSSTSVFRWTKLRRCRETKIENFSLSFSVVRCYCVTNLATAGTDHTWPADTGLLS